MKVKEFKLKHRCGCAYVVRTDDRAVLRQAKTHKKTALQTYCQACMGWKGWK